MMSDQDGHTVSSAVLLRSDTLALLSLVFPPVSLHRFTLTGDGEGEGEREGEGGDVLIINLIEECLLMTALASLGMIGSSVYNAAASVIRFLYVRSSLQQEINEVYKRTQFVYLSLFITGLLCLVHITDFYFYQTTRSTSH